MSEPASSVAPQAPKQGTPFNDDDLLAVAKLVSICNVSYRNSSLNTAHAEYETEAIRALHITDYKVWNETHIDSKSGESILGQALTGVISNLSKSNMDPIPFVCFRGTVSTDDMIADLLSIIPGNLTTVKGQTACGAGFGVIEKYTHLRDLGLLEHILTATQQCKNGLIVTGHSLGGAVANLLSAELLTDHIQLFQQQPLLICTFGAPRVFDLESAEKFNNMLEQSMNNTSNRDVNIKDTNNSTTLQFRHVRVMNEKDLISTMPPKEMPKITAASAKFLAAMQERGKLFHTGTAYLIPHDLRNRDIEVYGFREYFNFAPDPTDLNSWNLLEISLNFTLTLAEAHLIDTFNGYFNKFVQTKAYRQAVNTLLLGDADDSDTLTRNSVNKSAQQAEPPLSINNISTAAVYGWAQSALTDYLEQLYDKNPNIGGVDNTARNDAIRAGAAVGAAAANAALAHTPLQESFKHLPVCVLPADIIASNIPHAVSRAIQFFQSKPAEPQSQQQEQQQGVDSTSLLSNLYAMVNRGSAKSDNSSDKLNDDSTTSPNIDDTSNKSYFQIPPEVQAAAKFLQAWSSKGSKDWLALETLKTSTRTTSLWRHNNDDGNNINSDGSSSSNVCDKTCKQLDAQVALLHEKVDGLDNTLRLLCCHLKVEVPPTKTSSNCVNSRKNVGGMKENSASKYKPRWQRDLHSRNSRRKLHTFSSSEGTHLDTAEGTTSKLSPVRFFLSCVVPGVWNQFICGTMSQVCTSSRMVQILLLRMRR